MKNLTEVADCLKTLGYDIKHTHLLEALARGEGSRDWRTFKAGLAPTIPVMGFSADFNMPVFVEAFYANSDAENPCNHALITMTSEMIQGIRRIQAECVQDENKCSVALNIGCDWLLLSGDSRVSFSELVVTKTSFWFEGYLKHYAHHLETQIMDIDILFPELQLASRCKSPVVFWNIQDDLDFVENIKDVLLADHSDLSYISPEDLACGHNIDGEKFTQYMDLARARNYS